MVRKVRVTASAVSHAAPTEKVRDNLILADWRTPFTAEVVTLTRFNSPLIAGFKKDAKFASRLFLTIEIIFV